MPGGVAKCRREPAARFGALATALCNCCSAMDQTHGALSTAPLVSDRRDPRHEDEEHYEREQKRHELQRRLAHLLDRNLADRRGHEQRHAKRRGEKSDLAQHDEQNAELNGIDSEVWDPSKDSLIVKNYDEHLVKEGKRKNKKELAGHFGLDPDKPLIAFIGRLVGEKAADIHTRC